MFSRRRADGELSRRPREWVLVKRIFDHRPAVLLARRGAGADPPSAALNTAALIDVVARRPGQRILNIADPDCPNGLAIARTVASHLNYHWDEVLLMTAANPGSAPTRGTRSRPVVLDTSAATALGYRPEGSYSTTVADELDWLVAVAGHAPPGQALPADKDYFHAMMDYAPDDQYLAEHRT